MEVHSKSLAMRDIVEINTGWGRRERETVVCNDLPSVSGGGFVWRTFGYEAVK